MMKHILFTLKGCPFELLDDREFIRMLLYKTVKECKANLLDLNVHKFEPQGVTGFAMISESHISIHTWPENGMAVCDIFTCGDIAMPKIGAEYMKEQLKATDIVSNEFDRPLTIFPIAGKMKTTLTVDENGILTFPDELMEEIGWKEGDVLEWIPNDDGSFNLVKKEDA